MYSNRFYCRVSIQKFIPSLDVFLVSSLCLEEHFKLLVSAVIIDTWFSVLSSFSKSIYLYDN